MTLDTLPFRLFGLWALYQTALALTSNIHLTSYNIAIKMAPDTSTLNLEHWNTADCAIGKTQCQYQKILSTVLIADINATAEKAVSVVCLQSILKNQIDDVLKALSNDWAFIGVGQEDGLDKGEFVPIIYRKSIFSVIDKQNRWLSDTPEKAGTKFPEEPQPRVVTAVRFRIVATGKEFIVANNNLDDVSNKLRMSMFNVIVNTVEKLRGGKAIPAALVGTFSFDSRSQENLIYTEQGGSLAKYQDAFQMVKNNRSGLWSTYYFGLFNSRADFFWLGDKLSVSSNAKSAPQPDPIGTATPIRSYSDDDMTPGAYEKGTNVWTVSSYKVLDGYIGWGWSFHNSVAISASIS